MTTSELEQLARKTADKVDALVSECCDKRTWGDFNIRAQSLILSALEQVSREERKEAEALATALGFYASIDTYRASVTSEDVDPLASDCSDISDEHGIEYYIPGHTARAALAAWKEKQL